jgi:hypothetical protein
VPTTREPWTEAEETRLRDRPYDYAYFNLGFPGKRTKKAFQVKREMLGISRDHMLVLKPGTEDSPVLWDKKEATATWEDWIEPTAAMQAVAAASRKDQNEATIAFPGTHDVPVAFISDWHIGSWGTNAHDIARETKRLQDLHRQHGLYIAILGDMLEMAIRLRSVLEQNGNLLPTDMQFFFLRSWLEDVLAMTLWSTWDNHAVQREEELTGLSAYATLFSDRTIYHRGIGHVRLHIGDESYTVATSHRFPGRSRGNPVASQMRYLSEEAPQCDAAIAGDSHVPAIAQYYAGGAIRTVANAGALHTNSAFAERHCTLSTSDAMPVIVFSASRHCLTPYFSLDHFEQSVNMVES